MTVYKQIQRFHQAISAVERILNDLKHDAAQAPHAELTIDRQILTLSLTVLRQRVADVVDRHLGEEPISSVDLSGCRNAGERLYRIADATRGVVDLAKALDVMEIWWPTDTKRDTIRRDIHRWLKLHPDDWEMINPGMYRCLRYEGHDEQDDARDEGDHEAVTPLEEIHGKCYNSSNTDGTEERGERSAVPGPPESRHQWPYNSLDYAHSLINQQCPPTQDDCKVR